MNERVPKFVSHVTIDIYYYENFNPLFYICIWFPYKYLYILYVYTNKNIVAPLCMITIDVKTFIQEF